MKRTIMFASVLIFAVLIAGCGSPVAAEQHSPADSAPDIAAPPDAINEPGEVQVPEAPDVPGDDTPAEPQGFIFQAHGQQIYISMEAAPLLEKLPEPNDIFEQPSCAFDGVDITYFYPGFELTTYPDSGKEHVLSVMFTDDSITTPEGVYLGGSLSDIQNAYGSEYIQDGNRYTYTNGRENLIFTLQDGVIMGILYTLIIEE